MRCFFIYSQLIFHRNGIWPVVFFYVAQYTVNRVNLNLPVCTVQRPCALCTCAQCPPSPTSFLYNVFCLLTIWVYLYSCVFLKPYVQIVTDDFHRKTGTLESAEQLLIASCHICFILQFTVYRQWCRPPVHRVDVEASVLRGGRLVPSFLYTIVSSL